MRDRDREWSKLCEAWETDRLELVFVLGRRRVGKSFTLVPFAQAVDGIYYQATRRTEAKQLRALTRSIGERFDDAALRHAVSFPDWEALFGYLADKASGGRFLVAIDEFPDLESAAPAFPSILQSLVDHRLRESRIKLVLSGSHVSAMKRLERADQPLYARRTMRLNFAPFSYLDAASFVPQYDAIDRIKTYGIFGGVAGHLSLVDPNLDLPANVQRQILDPAARLFDEAQRSLDAFLTDAAIHYSIIEAIAAGERTWNGISNRLKKSAGSISRPISWLIDMEVIRRDVPVTVARPDRSKRALYAITDPYLAFWHRFVSPLIQSGVTATTSPERIWRRFIEPRLDHAMGAVFEDVCRAAVQERRDLLPFEPVRVGSWWSADSREQVNLVALSGGGEDPRRRTPRDGPGDDPFLRKLQCHVDEKAIAYDTKSDGMYPLLTNDRSLTPAQVLLAHKRQPTIEKRFEQMKSVFQIAPVLLKNEGRVEALFFVYFLA